MDFNPAAQKPGGDPFGSKEQLLELGNSSTPGKQQPPSLKDMVTGGKPNSNFSGKNPDLAAMEATSSDAASGAAATNTTPSQGGKPLSVSSPHQQAPLSASMMVKREIKQEIDGTPVAPSFPPSRHNSISSVANTPAEVRSVRVCVCVLVVCCVVCFHSVHCVWD